MFSKIQRAFILLILVTLSPALCQSQTSTCAEDPPVNEWLADSPWPIFHRNNYAQASSCVAGPMPGDELLIKVRKRIKGGTSPWTYISDVYPGGERVLVQSNSTHFFKFIDTEAGIVAIDSLRIDFDLLFSFGFAFLQARGNKWFVPDPKFDPSSDEYSRIIKIEDEDPDDPYSDLVEAGAFSFEGTPVQEVNHLMLNYSGQIIFTGTEDTENNVAHVGILDQDLNVLDILEYPIAADEIVKHNSSPVDENNSWYLVTTHRMIRFDWNGEEISIGWEAPYDFVNDGPTGIFAEGSGTTPTLMGYGDDADKLVIVADGHDQNNLVAFWREIPEDWNGIPGQDIRFADSIRIPYAAAFGNLFQSIENSPTVHDYSIAIAQYNGFLGYDCDNEKGVQKFTWNTETDEFDLDWATNEINMNGVLTYSEGSNLIYSSGKELDCNYYLYGLDWNTGELALRQLLGPATNTLNNDTYYDAGNNTVIDAEGNLFIPGGSSLIKVEKVGPSIAENFGLQSSKVEVYPNPVNNVLNLKIDGFDSVERIRLLNTNGRTVVDSGGTRRQIDVHGLRAGIYWLVVDSQNSSVNKRIVITD